jgi:hypothetical protein
MLHFLTSQLMKHLLALSLILGATFTGTVLAAEPTNPHSGIAKTPVIVATNIRKAEGSNARTVAEIVTKAAELKDKTVQVRGQVIKYNTGIMGKNWIHLQDGSGSADNGTNDLLITSTTQVKLGDVVTLSGVVRTNKDFGSGYSYKVLIEDATQQP